MPSALQSRYLKGFCFSKVLQQLLYPVRLSLPCRFRLRSQERWIRCHLFQMMKFKDEEIVRRVWNGITSHDKHSANIKMTAKSYEPEYRRSDWGTMIVDALKFCIVQKYHQCPQFRQELERSRGRYIIEQQANPKKPADTWSAKLEGDQWVGPNLTGRLLMQLRDTGTLPYSLPSDALAFLAIIKGK